MSEQEIKAQAPVELPETIEINGVKYRREGDWIDDHVNQINGYQAIAHRTKLEFWEVVQFLHPGNRYFSRG